MRIRFLPRRGARVCAAVLMALAQPSLAQELEDLVDQREREEEELRRIPGTETPGLVPEREPGKVSLPVGEPSARVRISQDRAVDPDAYLVGPGDGLQLYVWGELDQNISFEVNPEGYALVPTVGAFQVSNRPLSQVRREIIAAATKKYPGLQMTLSLRSMRYFSVYLTGAIVGREGQYTVTPVTRVSDLLEMAGGFADDFFGTEEVTTAAGKATRRVVRSPQPTARRSIRVVHVDGSVGLVDLAMFLSTGDLAHNPYLRMGDAVHIGYRNAEVFAYGSLNEEGVQEYLPGDTLGHLIRLAGGLSGSAPLDFAEVWRFRGSSDSTFVVSLLDSLAGEGPILTLDRVASFPLLPKDMLFIRSRSDWQQTPNVHAHGEFRYRGRYRIVQGRTRLLELIEQAGGLTDNANVLEARVIRTKYRAIRDPELLRLQAVQAAGGLADLSPEERAYLKTKARQERGAVAVDFQRLLAGDESQNITLEGGDVVFVPERRRTVSLSGQLKRPGLIDYEEGRRVDHYLAQVGGFAFRADENGARLIRARTGQREALEAQLVVEAGDEIWVPEKEHRDWWELVQGVMRTTAEALTLVVLVRAL